MKTRFLTEEPTEEEVTGYLFTGPVVASLMSKWTMMMARELIKKFDGKPVVRFIQAPPPPMYEYRVRPPQQVPTCIICDYLETICPTHPAGRAK